MTYYECYPDESFLKCLGFTSKELMGGHSFGRSNVCGKLKKVTNSLGLVDEDPFRSQDSHLKYLLSLKPVYDDNYLRCVKDSGRNNKLIVLKPDLEAFAIKLANDRQVNLVAYGLTSDYKKLHEILTLKDNRKQREKFMEFIADVSDHKAIVKLKELIKN